MPSEPGGTGEGVNLAPLLDIDRKNETNPTNAGIRFSFKKALNKPVKPLKASIASKIRAVGTWVTGLLLDFGRKRSKTLPERIYNPIMAMGFRQCLPFSWSKLRGKHCQHPIAVMGVVDTFGHGVSVRNLF